MDANEKRELRKRFKHAPEAELQAALTQRREVSNIAKAILTKRQRESRRSARIITWATVVTAIATAAAALATWIIVCRPQTAPNESRQPTRLLLPSLRLFHSEAMSINVASRC